MNYTTEHQGQLWEVFLQNKSGLPFKHAGSVHAHDKEMAIQNARDLYTRRNEGVGLWVVLANAIVSAMPEDSDSFFDPANDKIYRHPTFYSVPEGVENM